MRPSPCPPSWPGSGPGGSAPGARRRRARADQRGAPRRCSCAIRSYSRSEVRFINEEVVELGAVERNHRDALEILAMQLRIGLDVDLGERMADAQEDLAGLVAEVAAVARVEDQPAHRPPLRVA